MSSKERPIIFSGPMVRALLDGKKTQTRRIVKPQAAVLTDELARGLGVQPPAQQNHAVVPCPYGQPGDRLWVRETWKENPAIDFGNGHGAPLYRATWGNADTGDRWRPSIHMPRWASRITLEITNVRVQRLQEISEEDALAEGVDRPKSSDPRSVAELTLWRFRELWESIHGPDSWDANPWVWAITFKKLEAAS
jgi:hypothetical protein